MSSVTVIPLPLPTDETERGPILHVSRSSLEILYDQWDEHWAVLVFTEMLALDYRDGASCEAEGMIGAGELQSLSESPWLDQVMRQWTEAVGSHVWQEGQGGAQRFRHYRLYFDDAAAVSVVASSFRIRYPVPAPPRSSVDLSP